MVLQGRLWSGDPVCQGCWCLSLGWCLYQAGVSEMSSKSQASWVTFHPHGENVGRCSTGNRWSCWVSLCSSLHGEGGKDGKPAAQRVWLCTSTRREPLWRMLPAVIYLKNKFCFINVCELQKGLVSISVILWVNDGFRAMGQIEQLDIRVFTLHFRFTEKFSCVCSITVSTAFTSASARGPGIVNNQTEFKSLPHSLALWPLRLTGLL